MIVIGLGAGRTGTVSLSSLIGDQNNTICFHEMNVCSAVYEGNKQPIINTINEFDKITKGGDKHLLTIDYTRKSSVETYNKLIKKDIITNMGDVAYYYLNYVEDIIQVNSGVKFVCMKRDKESTVASWLKKSQINRHLSLKVADKLKALLTRAPYYESRNFWQNHDGTKWMPDPIWDKTFPKFNASSKKKAVEIYWEYYYEKADLLESLYGDSFKIFDIGMLSNKIGQQALLSFIGISDNEMRLAGEYHKHKSLI